MNLRLEIKQKGDLNGVEWVPCVFPKEILSNEVEVSVKTAAVNFSDVMKVLGIYPGVSDPAPLGLEFAGIVTEVGKEITRFKVGDSVVGCGRPSFSEKVRTTEDLILHKPAHWDFSEAVTVPIVFLTAYEALCELGKIEKGESVLVHAAAGGVGLAALQIIQSRKGEIFATVGSKEKEEFLRSKGVHHVFSSRSLDFAEEIRSITQEKGVDLVLNSLKEEFASKSLELLAPYGRFLEIGKTDIYNNRSLPLAPFRRHLSYFAIDLDYTLQHRPKKIRHLMLQLEKEFSEGVLSPLPFQLFPRSQVTDAFKWIKKRENIGKAVIQITS